MILQQESDSDRLSFKEEFEALINDILNLKSTKSLAGESCKFLGLMIAIFELIQLLLLLLKQEIVDMFCPLWLALVQVFLFLRLAALQSVIRNQPMLLQPKHVFLFKLHLPSRLYKNSIFSFHHHITTC